MATEKQIEANRLNALKSTGPKTDEGKAASRLNAVTHGLTATLTSAVAQSQSELEERKANWREELHPDGDFQESLFDQIVVETLRVERCQKTFLALCTQHARRAKVEWDGDRRRDAAFHRELSDSSLHDDFPDDDGADVDAIRRVADRVSC